MAEMKCVLLLNSKYLIKANYILKKKYLKLVSS